MDALTQQCNIGLLAAGAAAAKGKRGGIRSMVAAANIKSIGIGIGVGISRSNWSNSSSPLRFSSTTTTTNLLPLIRSVPPLSSSLSAAAPPGAHEETVVSTTPPQSQSKTAHVKFVLQRACLFGEHFFLVGDDPMLGLWDPSSAIPLEWSDGHLWMVEMDIPVGKSIQFKFLLRGLSGEVHWQPGPDRIVRVWDTENTIVVAEDWKNAEIQKITEQVLGEAEAAAVISTDNMNEGATESVPAIKEPNVAGIVTDDDSLKLPRILDHEMQISSSEGNPLLVSGLGPIHAVSTSSSVFPHAVNGNAADARLASDAALDCNSSQYRINGWDQSSRGRAETEACPEKQAETEETIALSEKPIGNTMATRYGIQMEDKADRKESNSQDFPWGLKEALRQLLLNLGFSINLPAD